MKTHIMRWAPQDYRTSRVRARSATTKDPILRTVYLEALNALYEAGGSLPADPAYLADEFLLPAKEIARCLPILDEIARSGSGRGGIFVHEGRIYNGRVRDDLIAEQAFRAEQAVYGSEGGRKSGKGRAKASPKDDRATPETPQVGPNPPSPSPLPSPSPAPSPAPEPSSGTPGIRIPPCEPSALNVAILAACAEIGTLSGKDPTEVLKAHSMIPPRRDGERATWIVSLDTASEPWRLRTHQDLQAELSRLKAPPDDENDEETSPHGLQTPEQWKRAREQRARAREQS